ncbi:MAG: hypothetical protein H6737_11840 [Alphaproteobacteria bacterium]|nr:hypothetical protein [Alphaproteobacteria bacterium]
MLALIVILTGCGTPTVDADECWDEPVSTLVVRGEADGMPLPLRAFARLTPTGWALDPIVLPVGSGVHRIETNEDYLVVDGCGDGVNGTFSYADRRVDEGPVELRVRDGAIQVEAIEAGTLDTVLDATLEITRGNGSCEGLVTGDVLDVALAVRIEAVSPGWTAVPGCELADPALQDGARFDLAIRPAEAVVPTSDPLGTPAFTLVGDGVRVSRPCDEGGFRVVGTGTLEVWIDDEAVASFPVVPTDAITDFTFALYREGRVLEPDRAYRWWELDRILAVPYGLVAGDRPVCSDAIGTGFRLATRGDNCHSTVEAIAGESSIQGRVDVTAAGVCRVDVIGDGLAEAAMTRTQRVRAE